MNHRTWCSNYEQNKAQMVLSHILKYICLTKMKAHDNFKER